MVLGGGTAGLLLQVRAPRSKPPLEAPRRGCAAPPAVPSPPPNPTPPALQGFRLYAGYRCFKDIEGAEESRMRQWCIFWCAACAAAPLPPLGALNRRRRRRRQAPPQTPYLNPTKLTPPHPTQTPNPKPRPPNNRVLVAAFTAAEPLADALLFWVPLYHSAKFCFACYLLANGMAGAQLVYARYARALIARHEPAVDSALASARSSAAGLATTYAAAAGRWAQVAVLQALASGQAAAAAGLRAEPAGTAAPAAAGGGSFRSARSSRSTECGEAFASAAPAGGFRSYLPDGLKGE
jgi:hypothetical protein